MLESEREEKTLSETVVKEAVGLGMESPLRESILEAVEEAEGRSGGRSSLPLSGALFGAGAALGYLAGRESVDLETPSLEEIEEPEIIEDVTGEGTDATTDEPSMETEETPEEGSSRLPKLLLLAGVVAVAVAVRRRLAGDEEEEWEPIEEFEPATTDREETGTDDEVETGTDEPDDIGTE